MSPPGTERPLILCIDDQQANLAIRKIFLESQGYSVLAAGSGREGIELLGKNRVDVLVLDYRMPDMDGEEVAAIVRRDHPELPIIALSGFVSDIPAGFQERVDAFVSKGSPPEQLLRALEKALGYRPAPQLKPDPEVIGHSLEHASQVREHVDRARLHVERTRKVAAETRERVARGSAQKKRPA